MHATLASFIGRIRKLAAEAKERLHDEAIMAAESEAWLAEYLKNPTAPAQAAGK